MANPSASPDLGSEPPRYSRIHVHDSSQFPLLYRLLVAYITNPDRALSLKEVVISPESLEHVRGIQKRPGFIELDAREADREILQETHIYRAVERLDLPTTKDKERWVRGLTWMKSEIVDEWAAEVHAERTGTTGSLLVQHFVELKNIEFAYYACALLLVLCPNIERLVYRDNEYRSVLRETLRRINYGSLPETHLSKLKEVVLLSTDDFTLDDDTCYNWMDILELLSMFHRLPSIEHLSAEAVDANPDAGYVVAFPPATANLKKISITHSAYGTDVIAPLARAPKALEEFTFTTGGRCNLHGCYNSRFGIEIGKALSCQKHSLRKLDLDIEEGYSAAVYFDHQSTDGGAPMHGYADHIGAEELLEGWEKLESREQVIDQMESQGPRIVMKMPDDKEYGNTIGSFRDFEVLTHLSLGLNAFFGVDDHRRQQNPPRMPFRLIDALPPTLEYLLIRDYTKGERPEADEQILELLDLQAERLPRLKQIEGIDKCVPGGVSVEDPEDEPELLWPPVKIDPTWVEVGSEHVD